MSQARVLIVHSEPSILALLGSMLQSLGHQIDEAANDRAAVRWLISPPSSDTRSTSAPALRSASSGRVSSACSTPSVARIAIRLPSSVLAMMPAPF